MIAPSRRTIVAALVALGIVFGVLVFVGGDCSKPIDAFPRRTLAVEFATSRAAVHRVFDDVCRQSVIERTQFADVPFIALYVLVGALASMRLAGPLAPSAIAWLAAVTIIAAGMFDLLEDAAILANTDHAWLRFVGADVHVYGVPKWALFFASSACLSAVMGLAAMKATAIGARAAVAIGAVMAAAGSATGFVGLFKPAYGAFFVALLLWFAAVVLSLTAPDSASRVPRA
jgi:hypothetical protein